jgi:hypothetical protein
VIFLVLSRSFSTVSAWANATPWKSGRGPAFRISYGMNRDDGNSLRTGSNPQHLSDLSQSRFRAAIGDTRSADSLHELNELFAGRRTGGARRLGSKDRRARSRAVPPREAIASASASGSSPSLAAALQKRHVPRSLMLVESNLEC